MIAVPMRPARVIRRAVARTAAVRPLERALVRLEARLRRDDDALAVLTWHRVDDATLRPTLYPGLVSATPDGFEREVGWLARRFRVLSIDDVRVARRVRRLPARAVLLTFDDGYRDFADHAWPVLRAASLPATLFVTTGALHDPGVFWWDRLYAAAGRAPDPDRPIQTPVGPVDVRALRDPTAFHAFLTRLKAMPHARTLAVVDAIERATPPAHARAADQPTLDAETLVRLAGEGLTVAPHTRTHPLLTRLPTPEGRGEVAGSCEDLAALGVPSAPVFAYPSGAVDDRVAGIVRDLGFELAFTTRRGLNRLGRSDRLRLARINVGAAAGPGLLAAQLIATSARAVAGARTTAPGAF